MALFGCSEAVEPGTPTPSATGDSAEPVVMPTEPCDDLGLSWKNTGGPLLIGYCAPCHASGLGEEERQGAPIGVDLETLELARSFGPRIVERAVTTMDMPPSGPLDPDDQLRLADWVACGMP